MFTIVISLSLDMEKVLHNYRNREQYLRFLVVLLFVSITCLVDAQIYSENFSTNTGKGNNQGTVDVAGVTQWSITTPGCVFSTDDYFYVNNSRMECTGNIVSTALNAGDAAIWLANAGAINISAYSSVSVSVLVGNATGNAGQILAQISLDGTNYMDIGYHTTSSISSSTYTATNIVGTNLYFRVLFHTVNSGTTLYIDNVSITGTTGTVDAAITATGAGSGVVPAGVTSLNVHSWGAGGGGGSSSGTNAGSGGGGGAYSFGSVSVTPGATYYYSVGAGGTGAAASAAGAATVGSDTWFNANTNAAPTLAVNGTLAKGGGLGSNNIGTVGAGGVSGSGVGALKISGAAGGLGHSSGGGSGGSSGTVLGITRLNASTTTNGMTGSAADVSGGVSGTDLGGNGGIGRGIGAFAGGTGTQPGGGGGGSNDLSGAEHLGGNGGAGQIILSYVVPPTYYWVGGTGNWSDFGAHWATSTGGGTFHASAPTASTNVVFDASSFSGGGQIVSINVDANCKNMTWTGATNSPTLDFTGSGLDLFVAGSMTFISAMYLTQTADPYIRFTSTSSGNTVTTASITLPTTYFEGVGGEWTLQDAFTQNNTARTLYVAGNLITGGFAVTAGIINVISGGTLTQSTSTVTANGSSTTIAGTVSVSTGTLDVNGTFNATGGAITFSGAGNLNLGGATITSLGTLTESTSTVSYDRAGAQSVLADTYYNLIIAGGGSAVKTAAGAVNVSNNLTVAATTTYAIAATTTTVTGISDINGTLTISTGTFDANGTFDATGGAITFSGAGNLNLGGATITSLGTFTASTSTVAFDGATAQSLSGTAPTFYNLTINNTSTGVTLGLNPTVTNTLTLTAGLLKAASYTLTLGTSSTNGTVSGGSATAYVCTYDATVIGYFKQFVNLKAATIYTYPVGDVTANNYTPLTFTVNDASTLAAGAFFTVSSIPLKVTGLNVALASYINRYWDGTATGITTPNYDISYTYVATDVNGGGTSANIRPIKLTAGTWYAPTTSTFTSPSLIKIGTGSNNGAKKLTWTGVTSFSLFGGAGDEASVLPIALVSFKGKSVGNDNELTWSTQTEKDNDFFTIEKTTDGSIFEIVSTMKGAGTTIQPQDYLLLDYNVQKIINYYRLKQTDFDGKNTTSELISIDNTKTGTLVRTVAQITNLLGQEINDNYRGVVIILYTDGSSEKELR